MRDLTASELFAAQEIVNAGLYNAAESLSFFMKDKISYDKLVFCNEVPDVQTKSAETNSNLNVLVTEIIGDIKGMCYLIFSNDEAKQLTDSALSSAMSKDEALMKEMYDATLLEVDNIIAASVITQFSNYLKLKIFGGVPSIKRSDTAGLQRLMEDNTRKGLFTINFKIIFRSSNHEFSPEFIWQFEEEFLNSVQRFSKSITPGKN